MSIHIFNELNIGT